MMTSKNTWVIVKNRYRLSSKIQLKFEFSFPQYIIGKCRLTIKDVSETRTKKISLSSRGLVFSDTIPLSWFTSSALIPWEKILQIAVSDTTESTDDVLEAPSSSKRKQPFEYCKIELNDPQELTIELPWPNEFKDYVQNNERLNIPPDA